MRVWTTCTLSPTRDSLFVPDKEHLVHKFYSVAVIKTLCHTSYFESAGIRIVVRIPCWLPLVNNMKLKSFLHLFPSISATSKNAGFRQFISFWLHFYTLICFSFILREMFSAWDLNTKDCPNHCNWIFFAKGAAKDAGRRTEKDKYTRVLNKKKHACKNLQMREEFTFLLHKLLQVKQLCCCFVLCSLLAFLTIWLLVKRGMWKIQSDKNCTQTKLRSAFAKAETASWWNCPFMSCNDAHWGSVRNAVRHFIRGCAVWWEEFVQLSTLWNTEEYCNVGNAYIYQLAKNKAADIAAKNEHIASWANLFWLSVKDILPSLFWWRFIRSIVSKRYCSPSIGLPVPGVDSKNCHLVPLLLKQEWPRTDPVSGKTCSRRVSHGSGGSHLTYNSK